MRRADERRLNAFTRILAGSTWLVEVFGGGSCVRQNRVVLAPVAGVKLSEVFRIQPGFDQPLIRQRRWQDEFVAGESTA